MCIYSSNILEIRRDERNMKIGEFAEQTGLPVMTIRYYMNIGLLTPGKQSRNWEFSQQDLDRVKEILLYKKCGFSLEDIALLLPSGGEGISEKEKNRLYKKEYDNILQRRTALEESLRMLNQKFRELEMSLPDTVPCGIPLELFTLTECPYCEKPLYWESVRMNRHQVEEGEGYCSCGFRAEVRGGILIAGNSASPIIRPVDTEIRTLRNRSAKDTSYIETFNQWLLSWLKQKRLNGKVIYEDVLNTYSFLNRAIPAVKSGARFIMCDTDLDVVRYYADSIHASCPEAQVMFMVDDGVHHALKKGCLDIVIDYAASELYQKFGYASASCCLSGYAHSGTVILGRFSCMVRKQPGERDPVECNELRYNLAALQSSMKDNGIRIDNEKYGEDSVDPSIYTGCLEGDVIKPYAFTGRWE